MNNIKSFFQSSIDPSKLSLTVESGSKTIIGIIGYFAVLKGLDSQVITSQLQATVDTLVTLITAGYTAYHALQTTYGLIRKMFVSKTA